MPHPFKVDVQVEVAASPADVWEAITTGPGLDGWFIGTPNAVEPELGGTVRTAYGDDSGESTITAWEPLARFAHAGTPGPDGVMHAMEFTLQGHAGGTTTVRLVHSGFLGDDWEAEYEALNEGDFMYLHQLGQYVRYFRGRRPVAISVWQPDSNDHAHAMGLLRDALGLRGDALEGAAVSVAPVGLPPLIGVVDFVSASILGVRTDDGLYRFLHSPQGVAYVGHHIYRDDLDEAATKAAWAAWQERTYTA